MTINEILSHVDHTELAPAATPDDIRRACIDAANAGTAAVCISPCYVKEAADYMHDLKINNENHIYPAICTVIGFPNGNMASDTKAFEALNSIQNGADELDMVINIGMLKSGHDEYVEHEIERLNSICKSSPVPHILKVIVEACLLTHEEKIRACEIITEAGADYIKTSTGFSIGGASFEDVKLFADHIGPKVKIKAAGGISSFVDAERFLDLGADRLGSSRLVKLANNDRALK